MTAPTFLDSAIRLEQQTIALRRDLHQHPELGFQEHRTARIVVDNLTMLGLEVTSGIAETGVAAVIEGGKPGPVVLLRFDMDALPIVEQTGAAYASQNPGVMHACGHDGHVAVGLAVARLLAERRAELPGVYKLIFQPAEEGQGGAARMIEAGILENPKPDYALALHIWNDRPFGWAGISDGPMMAAAEIFEIELTGKGGHGALPHTAVDPIVCAAQIINALQTIVSRSANPLETAVVSVTEIKAGDTYNVIPGRLFMQGTIRSIDAGIRDLILRRFEEIVRHTAAAGGCRVELKFISISPAVVNHPQVAETVRAAARSVLPDLTIEREFRTMGAEDMALVNALVPGCYFMVGSANDEKGLNFGHHHPRFDFDERVLVNGAALMCAAAVELAASDPLRKAG